MRFRVLCLALVASCNQPSDAPAIDAAPEFSHGALGGVPGGGFIPPTKVGGGGGAGTVTSIATIDPIEGGSITSTGTISLNYGSGLALSGSDLVVDTTVIAPLSDISGTSGDLAAFSGTHSVGNYAGSSPSACTGSVVTDAALSAAGALSLTCSSTGLVSGGTAGDIAVFGTGGTSVANYGGSSPSACTTGNVVTDTVLSAAGALTQTCSSLASIGAASGTGATNDLVKWSNTSGALTNASVADDGTTVSTAEPIVAASFGIGASGPTWKSGTTAPSGSCTGGSMYSQNAVSGPEAFYVCVGGTVGSWLAVAAGGGAISGLTSGTIPVASSATTLGNSSITSTTNVATLKSEVYTTCTDSTASSTGAVSSWSDPCTTLTFAPTAEYDIVGFSAPAGGGWQHLHIYNSKSATGFVYLYPENGIAAPAQRLTGFVNRWPLGPGDVIDMIYDPVQSRWTLGGVAQYQGTINALGAITSSSNLVSDTYVFSDNLLSVYLGNNADYDCLFETNAAATCYLDFHGYADGTTQLRSLEVDNGEGSGSTHAIASFNASDRTTQVYGGLRGNNGYQATHFEWDDDWITSPNYPNSTTTSAPFAMIGSVWVYQSTKTSVSQVASGGRPGVIELATTSGASAATSASLETDPSELAMQPGSTTSLGLEWVGGFPTLGLTSGLTYYSEIGFRNPTVKQGCYFLYDPDNHQSLIGSTGQNLAAVCDNGTATVYVLNGTGTCDASFTKGTVTAAALSWPSTNVLHLLVKYTTSEADFYTVSGTTQTQVCKITTNIPSATVSAMIDITNNASGVANIDTDFTSLTYDLASARSP